MRRVAFAVLILLALFGFINPSFAAPAYGTRLPQKFHLSIGGQTHVVLERKMDRDYGEINSLQHFLLLSFGITDWLSLDLKGGAGDIEQRPAAGGEVKYPAFMGGGYGFRLRLYDDAKTKAVFGFQHISVHPYSIFIGNTKNKGVLDDWQFSLLASHEWMGVTPYFGTKWSRMDYIHWVEDSRKRKKPDPGSSVGVIAGLDIPVTSRAWVNVEGQFVDVQAVAVSLNYAF
ncbi:MAG: hypothetical protein HZA28_04580 [Candidatus Omnitrophica bacterium]|nr:hypothetical protein [Candidatus Omnitrophota bacterium]